MSARLATAQRKGNVIASETERKDAVERGRQSIVHCTGQTINDKSQ